jgi:hypothetical protein
MSIPSLLSEPGRVDEPRAAQAYSKVLTEVATGGRPVIVRRNGEDFAAVVPLAYLELLREVATRQEVEQLAAQIDWTAAKVSRPPQEWFDDDDNPFEPEKGPLP